jgi:dTDP-4-dehydrorhamnose 3,5-epimerase
MALGWTTDRRRLVARHGRSYNGRLDVRGGTIVTRGNARESSAAMIRDSVEVDGSSIAVQRQSHLRGDGELRTDLIDGLRYHRPRTVSHNDGHLTEVIRTTWDVCQHPIVQVHVTTTFPGRVRGWGLHRRTVDRLFVASGSVRLVCYDGRRDSPSHGRLNEFYFGDRNPGLVVIPTGIYHGWKNIGPTESIVISMPTELYDHDDPDGEDLPWDAAATREVIPYTW